MSHKLMAVAQNFKTVAIQYPTALVVSIKAYKYLFSVKSIDPSVDSPAPGTSRSDREKLYYA